ncbi:MAG: hypothetical protein ISR50_02170 [Alphaproteobacteria bacterium]|nr:hypothetical protein [Alphaproteobacteria bacterium]MBL6951409.1 hypothetical protein [Alphaproteobacteria bacterium]
MEVNLSSSSTQVNDKIRQAEVKALRPVEKPDTARHEKDPAKAEFSGVKVAPRDGDEEQSSKSAVDSDTGRNIDVSV